MGLALSTVLPLVAFDRVGCPVCREHCCCRPAADRGLCTLSRPCRDGSPAGPVASPLQDRITAAIASIRVGAPLAPRRASIPATSLAARFVPSAPPDPPPRASS